MMTGQYPQALATLEEALQANLNSIQFIQEGYEVKKHNQNLQRDRELLVEYADLVQYRRWRYRDAWNQVAKGRCAL